MLVKSAVHGSPAQMVFKSAETAIAGEYDFVTAFRNCYNKARSLTQDFVGVAAPPSSAIRNIEEGY
jgi:hypothetical protein